MQATHVGVKIMHEKFKRMIPKVQTADSCFSLIGPCWCSAAQVDQQLQQIQQ